VVRDGGVQGKEILIEEATLSAGLRERCGDDAAHGISEVRKLHVTLHMPRCRVRHLSLVLRVTSGEDSGKGWRVREQLYRTPRNIYTINQRIASQPICIHADKTPLPKCKSPTDIEETSPFIRQSLQLPPELYPTPQCQTSPASSSPLRLQLP